MFKLLALAASANAACLRPVKNMPIPIFKAYSDYDCLNAASYCLDNSTVSCPIGTVCSETYHEMHKKDSPCVNTPVRKDWDSLTTAEKNKFTDAVNKLKHSDIYRNYDYMVKLHSDAYKTPSPWKGHDEASILYRNGDQKGPAFLPWHRAQLNEFEESLQIVSGDYSLTVPYWNYMRDAYKKDSVHTPLWSAQGIGSNGRTRDYRVTDGPFANWPLKYADLGEKFLERNIGVNFKHPGAVEDFIEAFEETTYDSPPYSAESKTGFRNFIEGFGKAARHGDSVPPSSDGAGDAKHGVSHLSVHAAAHAFIGKSMVNSTSPNDPAFFMLHAFTDALWMSWQKQQLKRFPGTTVYDHFQPQTGGPRGHTLHGPLTKLSDGVSAYDMLDYTKMPYTYDKLPVPKDILAELQQT